MSCFFGRYYGQNIIINILVFLYIIEDKNFFIRRKNMGKKIDLTGKTFGKLKVLEEVLERRNNKIYWKC
jgi:hypothetical protein